MIGKKLLAIIVLISIALVFASCRANVVEDKKDFEITSFDVCIEKGGNILESYPRKCELDGDFFEEGLDENFNQSEKTKCEEEGGEYRPFGILQSYQCNKKTNDSSKVCSDSSECESLCLNINGSGVCSPNSLNYGCIDIFENNEKVTICID